MAPQSELEELQGLEQIETELVLEAIYARYGYDLRDYSADSIRRRIRAAFVRSGLAHMGEFQHLLLKDPRFFATVLDDLTVQVSDMFRDPDFYRAFRERVVPVLKTYPELKIWHAGCSSGEEIYGAAIVLLEENLYERTQVYATDLSPGAIERARAGVYTKEQAAGFAKSYADSGGKRRFEDYYSAAYDRIVLHEALRKNVVFFQHNLVSDYALGEMHVIFCRNVMIYFGQKLRERVLDMLGHGLCRGGFLCLGSSEALPPASALLYASFSDRERIYRYRGGA